MVKADSAEEWLDFPGLKKGFVVPFVVHAFFIVEPRVSFKAQDRVGRVGQVGHVGRICLDGHALGPAPGRHCADGSAGWVLLSEP